MSLAFLVGGVCAVLYIHPIKQGLKPSIFGHVRENLFFVLYIHPIKQGLKLRWIKLQISIVESSLHTSNKTRIETCSELLSVNKFGRFFTYIQ